MSEQVKGFIDHLSNGANAEAGEAFKDALRDKVAASLDAQRIEVAKNIFNGTPEVHFSDPKPEYAGVSDRTDQIFDDKGQQITFEPNQPTETEAQAPVENEVK